MKTYSPKNFSSPWDIHFLQSLKTNLISKTTLSDAQPEFICSNSAILTLE